MKRFFKLSVLVLTISVLSETAQGAELAGANFPDRTSVKGVELILNGLGVRKATIFKIKAYVAGLYLAKKASDVNAILSNKKPKKIVMKFLRSVEASRLADGWVEGFESNSIAYSVLKERVQRLAGLMPDVKDGDIIEFEISDDLTIVKSNSKILTEVKGDDFSKGLLLVWLGPNPPNEDLKKGMLGVLDE
ncbi:MAG: chalcone isomerase family protein [Bdellovibrionota bacterium]